MMRLLHLSDLHFGTQTSLVKDALLDHVRKISVDLAVISGDFTQTGSTQEFMQGQDFLKDLELPFLCVPGNHDIPRYEMIERFTNPYRKFKKHISPELSPVLHYEDVCIVGITTSRPVLPHWNWANGCVSESQLEGMETAFAAWKSRYKVCVMHHPVHKVEGNPLQTVVFGGQKTLAALKRMKVDLVLTGHVHHASITTIDDGGHNTVFLSASTALSDRLRTHGNGFNVVTFGKDSIVIEIFLHSDGAFRCTETLEVRTA